jgi:hypothetical protein
MGPRRWGSLGRKGAARLSDEGIDARNSVGATDRDTRPAPAQRQSDAWERVDDVRREAGGAVERGRSAAEPRRSAGPARRNSSSSGPEDRRARRQAQAEREGTSTRRGRDPRNAGAGTGGASAKAELVAALGSSRGTRANERLRDAAQAFERERFEEARSLLKPLAEQAPSSASVRELLGLTYYRLERWADAARELEAFRTITDSTEQHPVLADAYRGLGRHREVEDLWEELREASPSGDLVTEGRIVMAGSLADRDRLADAVALLERSHRSGGRAQVHHLRQAYALADLYERAGDVARARQLFRWVVEHEPEFADAAERASALG